jgi:hypothetical protein
VVRSSALALAACCYLQPEIALAQDAAKQLVGTWKLISAPTKFDGGDTIEAFGPNPKGRLVLRLGARELGRPLSRECRNRNRVQNRSMLSQLTTDLEEFAVLIPP